MRIGAVKICKDLLGYGLGPCSRYLRGNWAQMSDKLPRYLVVMTLSGIAS